jgi:hypothetical protein
MSSFLRTEEVTKKILFFASTLILVSILSSCSDSNSETSLNQQSEAEEFIEEINADAKIDAEWQKLVAEKPELTTKCESFIKYRLGRNEVLNQESLLASIAASQSVVDATGDINLDVKLRLVKARQEAERQRGLALYWFNPWQTDVEDLIVGNKKLTSECNFTIDELIENMR